MLFFSLHDDRSKVHACSDIIPSALKDCLRLAKWSTRIPDALLELDCLAVELEDCVLEEELEDDRLPSKVTDCTMIGLATMEQSPLPLHFQLLIHLG